MSRKVDKLKKLAVALGYGSSVSQYTGETLVEVLKEIAVKMQCAPDTDSIRVHTTAGVIEYMADNYGSEENEPYNLTETKSHATVTYKLNGKNATVGNDKLYNGDKLKVTAEGATGYDLTTLTANGTAISSGDVITVNGHNIAIVASGTLKTFDLARTETNATVTVTKDGNAVADGENVLTYGDVITISAVATEGYALTALTVNGEAFTSGNTLTVSKDVAIVATAEAEEA